MVNFWGTLEVNCWSRDLGYDDYLNLHGSMRDMGVPVTREFYNSFYDSLEKQFNEQTKGGNNV